MAAYKTVQASRIIRTDLNDAEYRKIKVKSEETGISIARLIGDAVRQVHLGKKAA